MGMGEQKNRGNSGQWEDPMKESEMKDVRDTKDDRWMTFIVQRKLIQGHCTVCLDNSTFGSDKK